VGISESISNPRSSRVSTPSSGVLNFADVVECNRPVPFDCVVTPCFPEVVSILAEESGRLEN
jgi:hypothetical protein